MEQFKNICEIAMDCAIVVLDEDTKKIPGILIMNRKPEIFLLDGLADSIEHELLVDMTSMSQELVNDTDWFVLAKVNAKYIIRTAVMGLEFKAEGEFVHGDTYVLKTMTRRSVAYSNIKSPLDVFISKHNELISPLKVADNEVVQSFHNTISPIWAMIDEIKKMRMN